jgi:hypothetical protein
MRSHIAQTQEWVWRRRWSVEVAFSFLKCALSRNQPVQRFLIFDPRVFYAFAGGKKGKDASAQGRLLRALLKLKATEVQRHSDLLIGATKEQPSAAAAYLGAFPYSLEPRTADRW